MSYVTSAVRQGDCVEVMKSMPDKSVDVILTSPPYNWKKDYQEVSDNLPWDSYWSMLFNMSMEAIRILKDDGLFFLQTGSSGSMPLHSENIRRRVMAMPWHLQEHIIWQKATEDGRGHFTPISSPRFVNSMFEDIWILSKTGKVPFDRLSIGVPYSDPTNTTRWAHGREVRCRGDIWFIPYKTIQNRKSERDDHGATFPEELVERCLGLSGKPQGSVVLDPFAGRGTTPMTAHRMGYVGMGIELSTTLADAAIRNLKSMVDLSSRQEGSPS